MRSIQSLSLYKIPSSQSSLVGLQKKTVELGAAKASSGNAISRPGTVGWLDKRGDPRRESKIRKKVIGKNRAQSEDGRSLGTRPFILEGWVQIILYEEPVEIEI